MLSGCKTRGLARWTKRISAQKHSVVGHTRIPLPDNLHAIGLQKHADGRIKAMPLTQNSHQTHHRTRRKTANHWLLISYEPTSYWPYLQRPPRLLANKPRSESLVVKKIQHKVLPLLSMRSILATMAWARSSTMENNIKKKHLMKFKYYTALKIRIFQ